MVQNRLKLWHFVAGIMLALAACAPNTDKTVYIGDNGHRDAVSITESNWRSQVEYEGDHPVIIGAMRGNFTVGSQRLTLPSTANSIILGGGDDTVTIDLDAIRNASPDGDFECHYRQSSSRRSNMPDGIYAYEDESRTIHIQTRGGDNRVIVAQTNPEWTCLRIDWDDAAGTGGNRIALPIDYLYREPAWQLLEQVTWNADWHFTRNQNDLVFYTDAGKRSERVWVVMHGVFSPENRDQSFIISVFDPRTNQTVAEVDLREMGLGGTNTALRQHTQEWGSRQSGQSR